MTATPPSARTQYPWSLKTRIALVVLSLFLAGIWLFAYLTTSRLRQEFVQVLADQQLSSVGYAASEIEQKIEAHFEALEAVAREIDPALLAEPAKLRALLAARPVLTSIFGNGLVVVSRDGVGLVDHPAAPRRVGSSYRDIEYFKDVLATNRRTIGMPRVGRFTKRPGVGFAVPVIDRDGRTIAVFAGFATLSDPALFGAVQNARVGKTGWIAVSDARHRVIVAINDPKRILQPLPAPGANVMLDKFAAGGEGSGVSVNSQGREVLSSGKQIGRTGWFVQAVLPTAEAFEPIRGMQERAYLLAAALSALAALVVWLTIDRLLRPLIAAAALIRAMAAGKQEFRALPILRRDEVGELLASFNILFAQRQTLQDELERQARTDYLTGLPNRRDFMEAATRELARAARFGQPVGVLMLDVDHFKKINDAHGHKCGDLVLLELAATCRATLREIDLAARLGGEEFAVLLPNADAAAAAEVAERLRANLGATEVRRDVGLPLRFTVSIGVATLDGPGANIDTLLNRADAALYEAKRQGRDRVRVAS